MCHKIILSAALILLTGTDALQAQSNDFASFKPHAGDRFTYLQTFESVDYWHGAVSGTQRSTDTLDMLIVSVDTAVDSLHQHAVVVRNTISQWSGTPVTYNSWYLYSAGAAPVSLHPFAIERSDSARYDFSVATDTVYSVAGNPSQAYEYRRDTEWGPTPSTYQTYLRDAAIYAEPLHWLCAWSHTSGSPPPNFTYTEENANTVLIEATAAGVQPQRSTPAASASFDDLRGLLYVSTGGARGEITVELLDLLGRPLGSWRFPAESGMRQLSMNAGRIIEGFYFVRVSDAGSSGVSRLVVSQ